MKKLCSFLVSVVLLLTTFSSAFAQENTSDDQKEKKIAEIREYIEQSVSSIVSSLQALETQEHVTLEIVENTIEDYYKNHPAPNAFADLSLSLEDVFPEEVKQIREEYGKNFTLNLNDLINSKKQMKRKDDHLITLKHDSGEIDVYISKLGEIFILENKTLPNKESIQNENSALATWQYTRTERTTGVAYNALGLKMFTLWAEGSFKYNGSDVDHVNADGDWQRHFWGSTLDITTRALGSKRFEYVEGYKYAEVYSRLYFEAGFGIRWAQLTFNSGTVEVEVGSTVSGNLYGSATWVD